MRARPRRLPASSTTTGAGVTRSDAGAIVTLSAEADPAARTSLTGELSMGFVTYSTSIGAPSVRASALSAVASVLAAASTRLGPAFEPGSHTEESGSASANSATLATWFQYGIPSRHTFVSGVTSPRASASHRSHVVIASSVAPRSTHQLGRSESHAREAAGARSAGTVEVSDRLVAIRRSFRANRR